MVSLLPPPHCSIFCKTKLRIFRFKIYKYMFVNVDMIDLDLLKSCMLKTFNFINEKF